MNQYIVADDNVIVALATEQVLLFKGDRRRQFFGVNDKAGFRSGEVASNIVREQGGAVEVDEIVGVIGSGLGVSDIVLVDVDRIDGETLASKLAFDGEGISFISPAGTDN